MSKRTPPARRRSQGQGQGQAPARGEGYFLEARRPIQILAFLLPLVIAYELCLAVLLPAGDGLVNTVEAHRALLRFFAVFGIHPTGGLYIGGLAIVLVMLAWHLLTRERWHVDPGVTGLMAVEAVALALPLLVISRIVAGPAPAAAVVAAAAPRSFADLDIASQMAISVGAGLYEELMFRMILIALIHTLLVDLAGLRHPVGAVAAIAVSALAFTMYHDLHAAGGGISLHRVAFYLLAGLYFGAVYTLRGFGLVVGGHAVYDIITVLLAAAGTRALAGG